MSPEYPVMVVGASFGGAEEFIAAKVAVTVGSKVVPRLLTAVKGLLRSRSATAGDHIVLGLERFGLRETASKVGGRHLMDDPNFLTTVAKAAKDPNAKFTIALDGLRGSGTRSQVMGAVEDGLNNGYTNSFTNWELATLQRNGRLPDINFVRGGKPVSNPFRGGG
jgi:hypothetical protein